MAAWQYFAGYYPPPSSASDKGTAVHAILEEKIPWNDPIDRDTDEGAIAAEIVPFIPLEAYDADAEFEGRTSEDILEGRNPDGKPFEIRGRHVWSGYRDLFMPTWGTVDYKTTSDFKWMRTADDLKGDPQAIVYGKASLASYPGRATLRWIYSRTRKPFEARSVDTTLSAEYINEAFDALETFADEMQAAADACPSQSDPVALHKYILASIQGNESRCNDYGGCPHRSRCNIPVFRNPDDPIPGEKEHMSVLDRMAALAAEKTTTVKVTTDAEPEALTQAATPNALKTLPPAGQPEFMQRLEGTFAKAYKNGEPVTGETFTVHAAGPESPLQPGTYPIGPGPSERAAVVPEVPQINPPRRPGRPAGAKNKPKHDTIPVGPPLAALQAELADSLAKDAPTPAPAPAPAPAVPALSPAGSPLLTAIEADIQKALDPTPPQPIPVPVGKMIDVLCVGCVPLGRPFMTIDALLSEARQMVGDAAYFGGFGYKTNGLMSEAVTRLLTAKTDGGKRSIEVFVVQNPHLPEAALVLSYLRANSNEVVEALR